MKKPADFKIVASKRRGFQRTSALYNHLQSIGVEQVISLGSVIAHQAPSESREAYIFNLALDAALNNIFSSKGYVLQERHFRIDQLFNKMHGSNARDLLTHWHYTENYTKAGSEPIVLHVYFHYGILLKTTLRVGNHSLNDATLQQQTLAKTNAQAALDIVTKLIEMVKIRREELERKYDEKANQLGNIEHVIGLTPEELNEAMIDCRQIFDNLEIYQEDIVDNRFNLLQARIQKIINQHTAKTKRDVSEALTAQQANTLEKVDELGVTALSKLALVPVKKIRATNANEIDKIKIDLNIFLREFSQSEETTRLLELEEQRQNIKDRLLFAYFDVNEESGLQKRILILEKILDKSEKLLDKFTKFALDGNFLQVQLLYSSVANLIEHSFYLKLLVTYTSPFQPVAIEAGQVKICEFLYVNSNNYRILLSLLDTIYHGAVDDENKIIYTHSLLAAALIVNRLQILKTLVLQSGKVNIVGIIIDEKSLSLLDIACALSGPDGDLVKFLLAHSAEVDYKPKSAILLTAAAAADISMQIGFSTGTAQQLLNYSQGVDVKSIIEGILKKSDEPVAGECKQLSAAQMTSYRKQITAQYKAIYSAGCTLARYLEFGKDTEPDLISQIGNKTSTYNLLVALAGFSLVRINFMMLPTADRLGIDIHATKELRSQRVNNLAYGPIKFFSFLMCSERPGQFARLQALMKELYPRLSVVTDAMLLEFINLFDAQARVAVQRHDIYNAIILKRAKLFALAYYTPSLAIHQEIIKTQLESEELYMAYDSDKIDDNSKQQNALSCRVAIANLLNCSLFKSELITWCQSLVVQPANMPAAAPSARVAGRPVF